MSEAAARLGSTFRSFGAKRSYVERCALCAAVLQAEHDHVLESGARRPLCACRACGVLFDEGVGRYRRVPRDAKRLKDIELTDEMWGRLELPVELVFFQKSGAAGKTVAYYPSPGGVLESTLPLDAWTAVEARNPRLRELRDEVEALLANRVRGAREYFIVPIDRCFRLIGLIRMNWKGFMGGDALWDGLDSFFKELREQTDEI